MMSFSCISCRSLFTCSFRCGGKRRTGWLMGFESPVLMQCFKAPVRPKSVLLEANMSPYFRRRLENCTCSSLETCAPIVSARERSIYLFFGSSLVTVLAFCTLSTGTSLLRSSSISPIVMPLYIVTGTSLGLRRQTGTLLS